MRGGTMIGIMVGLSTVVCAMEYQKEEKTQQKEELDELDVTLVCKDDEEIIVPRSIIAISKIYKKSLLLDAESCNTIYSPNLDVDEVVLLIPLCNALYKRDSATVRERLAHYTKQELLSLSQLADYLAIPFLMDLLAQAMMPFVQEPKELMNVLALEEKSPDSLTDIFSLPPTIQHELVRLLLNDNPLKRRIIEHKSAKVYCHKYGNHSESIASICWSADGNCIALLSASKIRVEDINNGNHVSSFDHTKKTILSAIWDPHDDCLYVIDSSNTIYKWHYISGEIHIGSQLKVSKHIKSIHWSADSNYLALRLVDNTIIVYDRATGESIHTWYTYQEAGVIRWSPDGRYLALSTGTTIHIWETKKWDCVQTLPHDRVVSVGEWSADSRYIATGSFDGIIGVWETNTWKQEAQLPHTMGIQAMSLNHDGTYLASALFNNIIYVWNIKEKQKCYELSNLYFVNKIYWSPDGNTLLIVFPNYNICLWEVKNIYLCNKINLEQALFLEVLKNIKDSMVYTRKAVFSYKKNSQYLASLFTALPLSWQNILTSANMGLTGILAGMNILSNPAKELE